MTVLLALILEWTTSTRSLTIRTVSVEKATKSLTEGRTLPTYPQEVGVLYLLPYNTSKGAFCILYYQLLL